MKNRKSLICFTVCTVLCFVAVTCSSKQSGFKIYSNHITTQLQTGGEYFTNSEPEELKMLIVTMKVRNQETKIPQIGDFTMKVKSKKLNCDGIGFIDDPNSDTGMWAVNTSYRSTELAGDGIFTQYLSLVFLVPIDATKGSLFFKDKSLGRVRIRQ